MNAALLHPAVLHHVVNTLGWPSLRPLQEQSVEPIIAGRDAQRSHADRIEEAKGMRKF